MPPRTRIDVPDVAIERQIFYDDAFVGSLAEEYGTTVTGISSQEELHGLFTVQGMYLLWNADPAIAGQGLRQALRTMGTPHKNEGPFWRDDSSEPASARILVPYAPQYGYMSGREMAIGMPLRMTFGLLRVADKIRVARANVWICPDGKEDDKQLHRVVKDINSYTEFDSPEGAQQFFASRQRSRSNIGFALSRILKDLE